MSEAASVSPPPRFTARDIVIISGVLIFAALAFVFRPVGGFSTVSKPEQQRLFDALPADAVLANAAFNDRVRAKFPLKLKEEALTTALNSQGFASDSWLGVSKRMTFRNQPLPGHCDYTATIWWETDDQDRVSAINGRYLRGFGC